MDGGMATSVQVPAMLLIIFFSFCNCYSFVVSSDFHTLTVGDFASLQISPPARLEIIGLSRLTNLSTFFSSVKVIVNSTTRYPNTISLCFHRNASLAVGMCPEGQWEKLTKGSWVRSMSPFDHKFLDIRILGPSVGTLEVQLNQEFYLYRVIFLVLGVIMMTFASSLSNSILVYYGGAMTLGVMLVVLVILFQGMRILPSGRKSSIALVLYGSLIGVGSFLFSYIPTLLRSLLVDMGINEEMYSPIVVLLLAFVVLCGAWLGFWAVRKLVLTEDGSIDTAVAHFVTWSFRIVASSMILQCSVDPLLAVASLVCGILVPSALKGFYNYVHKMPFKTNKDKHRKSFKHVEDTYEDKHRIQKLSDSNTFYSSFHDTTARKRYSKDEWDEFTKESTKKALESLVSSPDFNRWAVANADRITLFPKKDASVQKGKSWLPWS